MSKVKIVPCKACGFMKNQDPTFKICDYYEFEKFRGDLFNIKDLRELSEVLIEFLEQQPDLDDEVAHIKAPGA